jgi:hypothetical protein
MCRQRSPADRIVRFRPAAAMGRAGHPCRARGRAVAGVNGRDLPGNRRPTVPCRGPAPRTVRTASSPGRGSVATWTPGREQPDKPIEASHEWGGKSTHRLAGPPPEMLASGHVVPVRPAELAPLVGPSRPSRAGSALRARVLVHAIQCDGIEGPAGYAGSQAGRNSARNPDTCPAVAGSPGACRLW